MEPQRAVNAHEEIGGLGGPQGQILCWAHSIVLKPAEDSKMEGTKDQYVGTNLQNLFRHLINNHSKFDKFKKNVFEVSYAAFVW